MPWNTEAIPEHPAFDDLQAIRAELNCAAERSPAGAEPAEGAPPYQRPFSASALKLFAECERKWFFRYLCNVVEDPGSSAASYGTAFHDALERFHTTRARPGEVPRETLLPELDQLILEAFARHVHAFSSPLEADLQGRRARRTAVRYVDWLILRARQAPFEVVGLETHAPLELDGFPFTGFIDRLDRDDASGSVTVLDYKTGSIAMSAAEYREALRAFHEFQLPFYYWSRTAAGDRVTRLSLIPLKDPLLEVAPIELEVVPGYAPPSGKGKRGTIGIAELESARTRMIAIATQMSVTTLSDFSTTNNSEHCTYCAYTFACRRRPFADSAPFAR
jgi:RecB family exonuclease